MTYLDTLVKENRFGIHQSLFRNYRPLECVRTPYYERNKRNDGGSIVGANQNIFVRVVTQDRRGSNSGGLIGVTGGVVERYIRTVEAGVYEGQAFSN